MSAMCESIRNSYKFARSLGYNGSSDEYLKIIQPEIDSVTFDECGKCIHRGPLKDAPGVNEISK